MPGKVLKIDVVVDENGTARRALTEIEGGVKKVEAAAQQSSVGLTDLDKKLANWDDRIGGIEESLTGAGSAAATAEASMVGLSMGMTGVLAVAGATGAAIYTLGSYVKDATEYYIEQSGVLEVNRQAIDDLKVSWDTLRYAVGELVVGGAGDYRSWLTLVNVGLIEMGTHLLAAVELYKQLAQFGKDAAIGGPSVNPFDAGAPPGIDTTERNPDGSLTPYGRMLEQRKQGAKGSYQFGDINGDPYSGASAEAQTMAEIAREKREQLELERQQKQEAAERLRLSNEIAKAENEITEAISRSRAQYDAELLAADRLNEKKKESLDIQIRDNYLKSTLTGGDFQKYKIGADADQKIASIDPRSDNASDLARRYVAERELALIQLRQSQEGFTQGVSDDLNHFRAEFADVVGSLPLEFQQAIPPILDASGAMRDGLSADLDAVRGKTGDVVEGFTTMGSSVRATHEEIAAGLKEWETAYEDAGIMVHKTMDVSRYRGQQTGGLLYAAGGYVERRYLAGGGPAGTDSVPAYLTPGEGVLSRTGMAALDRLNAGLSGNGRGGAPQISVSVDARGAQFTDEAALQRLTDRVAQRVAAVLETQGA
jgi:hypothetical protein